MLRASMACHSTAALRVTARSTSYGRAPLRAVPVPRLHRQSEFYGKTALDGMCSTLAGLSMSPVRQGPGRQLGMFRIEANAKKGLNATKVGTQRSRIRTSGYRTRRRTVGGRKVLQARRTKGRWVLVPASAHRKCSSK